MSRRETEMDGILHVEGLCCGGEYCHVRECGASSHSQGAYHGMMYTCEACPEDTKHWRPRGTYRTDDMVDGFGEPGSIVDN